ncbi:MAG TPA: YfiR family protein [Caulobacteraceae bacterium]|nr:YfiR family protein [Caulobacteraceae bacterium]
MRVRARPMTASRSLPRLAVVLALLCPPAPAPAQTALETAVKATFLYKFAPFVEWPASQSVPSAPFAICVIGKDPFGSALDRAVNGQRVGARPVVVRRLSVAAPDSPCQIAYLGGSRTQSVREGLGLLRQAPVLTVTEDPSERGIVEFTSAGGRVRFRLDDQAAAEAGLTISSKLLGLALSVTPRKE